MTNVNRRSKVKSFIENWKGKGYEKGECQPFWLSLLRDVCGIENPEKMIRFEEKVKIDNIAFIDGFIDATKVMIEQKSIELDLQAAVRQSDGSYLTPFQQAKRYAAELPYSKRPRWIVTSNFKEFLIYDMEQPQADPENILLENLDKEYYRLNFLVDEGNLKIRREMEISLKAGDLVGKLYDKLRLQYIDPTNPESLKSLNKLCVRLVFCMYAEDAGLFGERDMFVNYLKRFHPRNTRMALIELFKILNTKEADRDQYANKELLAFPYVNGGLFSDTNIEIPSFTEEIVNIIENDCCLNFDWSGISPTIFGAVFESTLNPDTRRNGGMHYTSIENIHKVIDPLFLTSLSNKLDSISKIGQTKLRIRQLREFQEMLGSLRFLDPACGSGNFLTETYISLRGLENKALRMIYGSGFAIMDFGEEHSPIRVSIDQFYGIEINDFAVTVAKTALWISEAQMQHETEDIIHADLNYFPLHNYDNIIETNALTIDWNNVIPNNQVNYIIGNPPFVGARHMNHDQKEALVSVFGRKWKNVGNLDFVCAWYKKAVDYMKGTGIKAALVSTNSICQGENVTNLWKPLFNEGISINYAHRTFRWDSESNQKAHVHCVIIGFSYTDSLHKTIFTDNRPKTVKHINAYLIDADDIFVESRSKPLCNVPSMGIGNKPIDDGNFLFQKEEMEEFIKIEPSSKEYFRPFYGSIEFINQRPRYCLWLGDCTPSDLRRMPHCLHRIENVRIFRLNSKSEATRKLADKPTRFHVENMPGTDFLIIPKISSEKRRYIPIGFMSPSTICSDLVQIIPNATLYHFGVLTSNVHMAWMRAVCGRLEMRYRYSNKIVYNNFPWPKVSHEQKEKITKTAQAILNARSLYPNSSFADLYNETTMPVELRKAHQANDKAVMEAYGFPIKNFTETDCVEALMNLYKRLTEQ